MQSGPLYEATFFVATTSVRNFDDWFKTHVRGVLHEPGIIDCNVLSSATDQDGRGRATCLYEFFDDEALDVFLRDGVEQLDDELAATFEGQVELLGRVLREDPQIDMPADEASICLNCGARLAGQYCGSCGQRSRNRLISLWELISDAFGDLLEIDSRLWQTLIPLLRRPGQLTHDYLQGRRVRYMPPFRMYLVLSLLFFVVAFFDPHEDLGLLFEPAPEPTAEEIAAELAVKQEILEELAEEGIIGSADLPTGVAVNESGLNSSIDEQGAEVGSECDIEASGLEDLPDWLARRLTPERLQRICEQTEIDDGRALLDKLLDNIPAALIILLPLMAMVLKALYPLSKRYYVEHLLFFIHFHAFFFLILSLQILFTRLAALLHVPEVISILTIVATSLYVPVYLFVAMRRVYAQGRLITSIKYIVLVVAYSLGFFTTMLGALAIAAFSI
ncbi:MAG: DUF3667 domain-containing protein [Gammaproteobacteria bacterium]|nr:DUF3667 domain-containing protein [Gammaproteobacteria bacterium]